jgi:hypothetical protein
MPRMNIVSQVNSKKITRSGNRITLRDVVPIVDDIVMNGILYPAANVKAATPSLNSVPMPMGHPQDKQGNYISASSGEALLNDYAGAIATNARHDGTKSLIDVVVNVDQANAHTDGVELVKRLEAAMNGKTIEPIHISTGVLLTKTPMEGTSKGKAHNAVAGSMSYDHVAILLHQEGAGTPSEGVGMYLNAAGESEELETVFLETNEDKSLLDKFKEFLLNIDFNALPKNDVQLNDVQILHKVDHMKESIIAALNAAGIATEGKDEAALLSAYNALVTKPVSDKLTAANSKIAEFEQVANAAKDAELTELANKLVANSSLTLDELKSLGAPRLKELSAKAAPIIANTGAPQTTNTAFDTL